MASDSTPSFDELEPIETQTNDDEESVPTISLDPGEELVAEVRYIEQNVGQWDNTVLHLTREGELCKMWSNGTIDRALASADVGPGDVIGVRKSEETYTYETDDGDGGEAYDFDVRKLGGDQ